MSNWFMVVSTYPLPRSRPPSSTLFYERSYQITLGKPTLASRSCDLPSVTWSPETKIVRDPLKVPRKGLKHCHASNKKKVLEVFKSCYLSFLYKWREEWVVSSRTSLGLCLDLLLLMTFSPVRYSMISPKHHVPDTHQNRYRESAKSSHDSPSQVVINPTRSWWAVMK